MFFLGENIRTIKKAGLKILNACCISVVPLGLEFLQHSSVMWHLFNVKCNYKNNHVTIILDSHTNIQSSLQ